MISADFHRLASSLLFANMAASSALAAELALVPNIDMVQPGQQVIVEIMSDFQDESTIGGGMDVMFDPAVYEFVSYVANPIGDPQYRRNPDTDAGLLSSAAFGAFNGYLEAEVIATVTFNVRSDAPSGQSNITIAASSGVAGPFVSFVDFEEQTVDFIPAQITVTPTCAYAVTSPNGGEAWNLNSVHAIRWASAGGDCDSAVKIELFDGGVLEAVIAASTPNDGSFTWVVAGIPPDSDYRVRVTDVSNAAFLDVSDNDFSIVDLPGFIFSSSYE